MYCLSYLEQKLKPTERGALCRGVAGPVEVSPRGVTRVVWELDDGEHVEESLRPVSGLRTGLLGLVIAPGPGDTQEDKKNCGNKTGNSRHFLGRHQVADWRRVCRTCEKFT